MQDRHALLRGCHLAILHPGQHLQCSSACFSYIRSKLRSKLLEMLVRMKFCTKVLNTLPAPLLVLSLLCMRLLWTGSVSTVAEDCLLLTAVLTACRYAHI